MPESGESQVMSDLQLIDVHKAYCQNQAGPPEKPPGDCQAEASPFHLLAEHVSFTVTFSK